MERSEYGLLQANFFRNMLKELDLEINPHSTILDFGCGEGWIVYHFRKMGVNAFGVDIVNDYDSVQELCKEDGMAKADEDIFRIIDLNNYRIPFDDDTFDL